MLVFEERGNRKTSRCRVENQQTQPTYDAEFGNRTRATLLGGECSQNYVILAPHSMFDHFLHFLLFTFRHARVISPFERKTAVHTGGGENGGQIWREIRNAANMILTALEKNLTDPMKVYGLVLGCS